MTDKKKIDYNKLNNEKEMEERLNTPIPPSKVENPKSVLRHVWYGVTIFINLLYIILLVGIGIVSQFNLYLLAILGFIAMPIMLVNNVLFWVRIYFDRHQVKAILGKALPQNYLLMTFWLPSRRKERRLVNRPKLSKNSEGYSVKLGDCEYMVDEEATYINDDGFTECDYLPNFPNPMLLLINKLLQSYQKVFEEGNSINFKDSNNQPVDISFSSTYLKEFKKTRFFENLTKSSEEVKFYQKLCLGFFAVIILLIVLLVIVLVIK